MAITVGVCFGFHLSACVSLFCLLYLFFVHLLLLIFVAMVGFLDYYSLFICICVTGCLSILL